MKRDNWIVNSHPRPDTTVISESKNMLLTTSNFDNFGPGVIQCLIQLWMLLIEAVTQTQLALLVETPPIHVALL